MRLLTTLSTLVLLSAVVGCTVAPIMNVTDAVVVAPAGKTLTNEQVRTAIVRAGAGLGWQMTDEGPGKLVGTLNLRTHSAVVEIPYSAKSYSIKYRSSVNLNEQGGNIHKNYNGWVQNLTKAINTQLGLS